MSDHPHTPANEPTSRPDTADPAVDPAPIDQDQLGQNPVDQDPVDQDPVDLDAVERDLAAVERALERLSDGTYWTDEVTGEPIPADVLAADPTTRRA